MPNTGMTIGLIKSLAKIDPETIKGSVEDWLDDHPEATTTVQDGAISYAKLDTSLKESVDDVSDLKSEINNTVQLDGIEQVTPQNLQIVDAEISPNLIDESKITTGKYVQKNGTESTGNYKVTDYIPVEAGEKYYFSWKYQGSRTQGGLRFLACYDSSKAVISSAGSDTWTESPFTIAESVAFVRLSFSTHTSYSEYQFEKGETPTTYHAYGLISAVVKDDYLPVTAADVEAVRTGLAGKVDLTGTDQVTPKNLQIVKKTYSPNLYNPATVTDGIFLTPSSGAVNTNSGYLTTDYIPVEAGQKYIGSWSWGSTGTNSHDMGLNFVTCYDSSKAVVGSAGMTSPSQPITIPSGVAYIRISHSNDSYYASRQFEKGETATAYHAYGEILDYVIKDEYMPDVSMEQIPAFELVDGQNLFNKNDSDYVEGKFLSIAGELSDNSGYATTGYVAVKPGDYLVFGYLPNNSTSVNQAMMRTVACYDASKTAKSTKGKYSVNEFLVPSGISYVRVCFSKGSYGTNMQLQKVSLYESYSAKYKEYEDPHYELQKPYMYGIPSKPVHAYLPSDIYVAVGRTIELYNEQVVLDHEKYHFRWVCGKGAAYKRKFSITGDTAGNHNLRLELYDDEKNLVWSGVTAIHIVSASNPTKKILPIGDSLTNWKAWLQETMLLSSNNIEFVGTRYSGQSVDSAGNTYPSGTIHSEGRSGFSAGDYLADTSYTFDSRYDGVGTVAGSANPFWDGSKFSLNHYLTTQTGVQTPDAVQIFLGTNDLTESVEAATENITAMVQSIRSEYADMPIFVCNTIYRSNQNGYGSTGNDAYQAGNGASAYQYHQDTKVMDLMIALRIALSSVSGLYFIPLATCMDREYGFGQIMTNVNPRCTVQIPMPEESVHPVASGYYQMADLMYSFYCGVLTD